MTTSPDPTPTTADEPVAGVVPSQLDRIEANTEALLDLVQGLTEAFPMLPFPARVAIKRALKKAGRDHD